MVMDHGSNRNEVDAIKLEGMEPAALLWVVVTNTTSDSARDLFRPVLVL